MRHLAIRFLKQGMVNIEIPNDVDETHFVQICKEHLDKLSDQDLLIAMSDVVPSGANPTRFDADSFQVEAIEDIDNDYEVISQTKLWEVYTND